MEQLYLLTIFAFAIIFVISFIFVKKRKKIVGFILPVLFSGQQLYVFFTGYKGETLLTNTSDLVKNNLILGISLFVVMVVVLIIFNKKFSKSSGKDKDND